MSSWERARGIPWSRLKVDGDDVETHKERVWRDLSREAAAETEADLKDPTKKVEIPYSTEDLLKMAAFGGTIGGITGAVFGFMDGMRTVGESDLLKNASNSAKGKYLMEGTSRSSLLFGGFFAGFNIIKYGLRVATQQQNEWTEIGVAGAISMGALLAKPAFRPSMPYAGMLIIMDGAHIVMREMDKQ
mmetsp:Transcript_35790/g.50713  ORF Transcript_35790/g.50713 Transcript_35790/m.50713 type:complete len:188 (+) Transcript_35790:81-644(+)